MRLFARAGTLVAVAGLLALGSAGPAQAAEGFELMLSGPTAPVAGQPVVVQAIGANPPPVEYPYMVWLSAVVLRPSAVPTCPESKGAANQLATGTGGAILTIAQREEVDELGLFSVPIGLTPLAPGPLLICAYSYNEVGFTLALASLTLDVTSSAPAPPPAPAAPATPAAPAAPAVPANVTPPRVSRSGRRLVCSPGTWSNDPSGYAYRWLVDGKPGTRGRTLRVTRKLRGRRVQCSVTASNAGGGATAVSAKLRVKGSR